MFGKIKVYLFFFIMVISSLSALENDKIYIDEDDFSNEKDAFHVHIGNNLWIKTNTVHRDCSGLFTYECNISMMSGMKAEYEKTWKCHYCYNYWPIGNPCGNPSFRSK